MLENARINNLLKTCLGGLSNRQKEVLEGRYGLNGGEVLTLAELGSRYGLTRERVRQIEAIALKGAHQNASAVGFDYFVRLVSGALKNTGGVKREDLLMEELAPVNQGNRLKFLLEICGRFKYAKDGKNFYPYWYASDADQQKAQNFVDYLVKNANRDNFTASFVSAVKYAGISDSAARHYASISKKVGRNVYGDLGLSEWPEINPKTARDWAYLVLKKGKKSLHFNEIAKVITDLRKKKAHAPTVHNELIKDENFVLVGKGTYTLKEFGVIPGTAKEIISYFLKEQGPMKANDIVKLVLKERFFKENTILINLQNRRNFRRLDDGRYTTLV